LNLTPNILKLILDIETIPKQVQIIP